MIVPISVYLNARTYRRSTRPIERTIATMGIIVPISYLNQAFGDMGYIHIMPTTLLGLSIAAAARLSVASGAWPSGVKASRMASVGATGK